MDGWMDLIVALIIYIIESKKDRERSELKTLA
jgi:hypothetical protein